MRERLTMICEQCGITFSKPSYLSAKMWEKRKFCSMKCSLEVTGIKKGEPLPEKMRIGMVGRISSNKGKPSKNKGAKHYNWKGGIQKKKCLVCNKEFDVNPGRYEVAKFCSMICKNINQDKGISTENEKTRRSIKYKQWRKSVFERDNYTCQDCGKRGGTLNADHIKPFAYYPEDRFKLENGKTLCTPCHLKTPTHGPKVHKYMQNISNDE